ncbi:hypothetical protein ASPVEDRAFT_262466 [Aspergillus versicolor CBS 583.65]|uniref:Uncharacterized protein n=1 Tax=Aspergillus versicolor CBS 583.65 TaxID=1036611 RepID=A0A1L9P672_ASPVE|nr:uncharacterized protein ASPVEDRAFT_262466 [Aspergillus versicolor CBS 583.65]OJI96944.1 hypothetical protein ASPVEDRAFT_262466 [Aspergillus versicolor CBS 583.65]
MPRAKSAPQRATLAISKVRRPTDQKATIFSPDIEDHPGNHIKMVSTFLNTALRNTRRNCFSWITEHHTRPKGPEWLAL